MKQAFFAVILLTLFTICRSQNVGIGVANPSEKLDIKGNVNLTGTIKANGIAGTNGQVLTSTGTGLSWASAGSIMGYKKCIIPGSGWVVPANVTEIMVEVWGAGAGGAGNAGGISGSYGRTVKTVTPGATITISFGTGGQGQNGSTNPTSGSSSKVTFPDGSYLEAYGGVISSLNAVTDGWIGFPTTGNAYLLDNYLLIPGNMGERTSRVFGQKSSTVYTEQVRYGMGGMPPGLLFNIPNTGSSYYYENGSSVFSRSARLPYIANPYYATGGSADYDNSGQPGGSGLVLIWWN